MTNPGPALDDNGNSVGTNDLVDCLYKIYEGEKVVDCAWVTGKVCRIDFDFGYYYYVVKFKFEGKELRSSFSSSEIKFRDRLPAVKIEVREGSPNEILWNEEDFT
jgi:hypothetical protein